MKRTLLALLIACFCSTISAGTRVALCSTGESADSVADVATALLSASADVELLERKGMAKLLSEHKLSLAGFTNRATAVKAGKLLKADLLAIVEAGTKDHPIPGLTVFDAQTGIRLWDSALSGDDAAENGRFVATGVTVAAKKRAGFLKKTVRSASLLGVRNVNMPRDEDAHLVSIVRAVERLLINEPSLVILERRHLRTLNDERNLPGGKTLSGLLPSVHVLDLVFERGKNGAVVICTVNEGNKPLQSVTLSPDMLKKGTASTEIAAGLMKGLGLSAESIREKDLKREAERFLAESYFRLAHQQMTAATEAAEAAVVLNPGSFEYRMHLAECLFYEAEHVLGQYQRTGALEVKTTPEAMMRSLRLASRGIDQLQASNSDGHLDLNSLYYLVRYMEKPLKTVRGHNDETRRELAILQRRIARSTKALFNELYENRVKNRKAFFGAFKLRVPIMMEISSTTTDEFTESFCRVLGRACQEIAASKGNDYPSVLEVLSALDDENWVRPFKLTAKHRQKVASCLESLVKSANPKVRLHGRTCLFFWEANFEKSLDKKAVALDRLLGEMKAEITRELHTPKNARLNSYYDLITACDSVTHNVLEFPGALDRYVSIAEFMVANKEAELGVLLSVSQGVVACGSKEQSAKLIPVLEKGIRQARLALGKTVTKDDEMKLRHLQTWRIEMIESHDLKATVATPWTSERLLFSVNAHEGIRRITEPVLEGNEVVVAGLGTDEGIGPYVRLVRVNVLTGKVVYGKAYPLSWDVRSRTPREVTSSFVGKDYFYVGTQRHGLYGLPLGSKPLLRLTRKEGLPSDYVQSVGELNGAVYLGIGTPRKAACLIRYRGKTKTLETLASSSRKPKQSPFDDVTNPFSIGPFLNDPKRKQLLFQARADNGASGLWRVDETTEKMSRILRMRWGADTLCFNDPDTVIIDNKHATVALNLNTKKVELLASMNGQREPLYHGGKALTPTFPAPAIFAPSVRLGDRYWTAFAWAQTPAGGSAEVLPSPKCAVHKSGFTPHQMLCLASDRKSVICADSFQIIRLTLPTDGGDADDN